MTMKRVIVRGTPMTGFYCNGTPVNAASAASRLFWKCGSRADGWGSRTFRWNQYPPLTSASSLVASHSWVR
jgi:hypothetical protein